MQGYRMKQIILIGYLIFKGIIIVSAQNDFEKSRQLFDQENYAEALKSFKELLEEYPNDPEYNYYAGVSLFYLQSDWQQCLEYLKLAEGSEIHPKQYYYLGRAYLNNIQPDKAYLHLLEYKSKKPRFALESNATDQWIEAARTLKEAIKKATIYEAPFHITTDNEGHKIYNQQRLPAGSWVIKDDVFFIEAGIKAENILVFQPSPLQSGEQCIYLSGSKGLFRSNADIFKYCESTGVYDKQINPLPGNINSVFNEVQAVFNPTDNTLYFSSNRTGGYGGYDIYKSIYNPQTDSWSNPVNLGFPVNTPFDEFFLGPASDNQNEYFISTNRYTSNEQWQVFGLREVEKQALNLSNEPQLLLAAAQFKPLSFEPEKDDAIALTETKTSATEAQPVFEIDEEKYNQILERALDLQLKADSIHRLADEQRFQLSSAENETKRMAVIRKIEALESEAGIIQKNADLKFAKARRMELAAEHKLKQNPAKIEQSGNTSTTVIDRNIIKNRLGSQTKTPQGNKDELNQADALNQFTVHASSVYSPDNPFQMDYETEYGLLYRIQLGVFSKPVPYNYFGGLWPITGEEITNREMKKYYAGLFSHRNEAEKALLSVRKEGFTDAFIVAWFNGKKVSLNRASDIEKTLYSNSSSSIK